MPNYSIVKTRNKKWDRNWMRQTMKKQFKQRTTHIYISSLRFKVQTDNTTDREKPFSEYVTKQRNKRRLSAKRMQYLCMPRWTSWIKRESSTLLTEPHKSLTSSSDPAESHCRLLSSSRNSGFGAVSVRGGGGGTVAQPETTVARRRHARLRSKEASKEGGKVFQQRGRTCVTRELSLIE